GVGLACSLLASAVGLGAGEVSWALGLAEVAGALLATGEAAALETVGLASVVEASVFPWLPQADKRRTAQTAEIADALLKVVDIRVPSRVINGM
uniref:hypothetical protein n=3 Tax=Rothia nasimurium TaxID=85336 RepID=UPI001F41152A